MNALLILHSKYIRWVIVLPPIEMYLIIENRNVNFTNDALSKVYVMCIQDEKLCSYN